MVHVVQCGHVDAQRPRHAFHVQPEGLEQFYEVHLFAGDRVVQFGAGTVALGPGATLEAPVRAVRRGLPVRPRRRTQRSVVVFVRGVVVVGEVVSGFVSLVHVIAEDSATCNDSFTSN